MKSGRYNLGLAQTRGVWKTKKGLSTATQQWITLFLFSYCEMMQLKYIYFYKQVIKTLLHVFFHKQMGSVFRT